MNDSNGVTLPRARKNRIRRTPIWIFIQALCRIINSVFFDLKTHGVYNVPKTGGVLLVSNHQSYLDPIILSSGLDRTLSYLAKSELFRNRFFAWLIGSLNAFPVQQGSGDVGAVKEAINRLQEGHLLNIYPEGSRTENGEIGSLEPGVALVIRRAKVPVVPVAITGSYESWPKSKKNIHFRPIRIYIGPPMNELWKLDRDEIMATLDATLRKMYDDVRAGRIPPNPPRPPGR